MDPGVWTFGGIKLTEKPAFKVDETRVVWPLSKSVVVSITFLGGDVRPSDIEMLCKYLSLMKAALERGD
jgi:hypothetical protein